jgi:antirestriction protein ArdC
MRSRKFNAESGAEQQDVHARVTSKIVEMLENGVRPWAQPWQAGKLGTRPLRHNGVP